MLWGDRVKQNVAGDATLKVRTCQDREQAELFDAPQSRARRRRAFVAGVSTLDEFVLAAKQPG